MMHTALRNARTTFSMENVFRSLNASDHDA